MHFSTSASSTLRQYWKNSKGLVLLGSSHTAPLAVLPIFLPSEFSSRVMVMAWASLPNFLRISSVPPSMLLH